MANINLPDWLQIPVNLQLIKPATANEVQVAISEHTDWDSLPELLQQAITIAFLVKESSSVS